MKKNYFGWSGSSIWAQLSYHLKSDEEQPEVTWPEMTSVTRPEMTYFFPVLFSPLLFSSLLFFLHFCFPLLFSRTFFIFFPYFFSVLFFSRIFFIFFFRTFFHVFFSRTIFPYYSPVLFQKLRRLKSNVLKYQWVVFLVRVVISQFMFLEEYAFKRHP